MSNPKFTIFVVKHYAMKSSSQITIALAIIFLSIGRFYGFSQSDYPALSPEAEISLMTCGPGTELYAMFGHSALWVHDQETGVDRMYNYGTFDFNDPNFYYKFARGIANYKLSVTNSRSFLQEYIGENRTVEMQKLTLSSDEKQMLFEAVEENYKPENRYYRYDFLFLNCSSIIRDRVFETIESDYLIDTSDYQQSFRDLLQPYITNPWISLGINFLLGQKADREASNWERMFLPDHMHDQFERTQLGNGELLAPESTTVYLSTNPPPEANQNALNAPLIIFFLLFIGTGILTSKRFYVKKWNKPVDTVLFLVSGLMGILLTFLWIFSEHHVIHQNLNLIWAFPLHVIFAVALWIPAARKISEQYARILFAGSVIFLVLTVLGIQEVPLALLLFCGILMLRLFRYAFFTKISQQV